MTSTIVETLPIRLTNFFLSTAGFAIPVSRRERTIVNVITVYSTIALTFGCCVSGMDVFYCWGTFHEFVYSFIAFGSSGIVQVKFTAFMFKKTKYLRLMKYTKNILWTKHHNEYGKYVIKKCEKQAMYFIIGFTCLALGVIIMYAAQALVLNIGRNETDRVFPVPLWIDLPIYSTPWYEITFLMQVLSFSHTGICYFCFDNFLALTNIFVTGQFEILRNRLEVLFDKHHSLIEFHKKDKNIEKLNLSQGSSIEETFDEFKQCVEQHEVLLDLVEDVEDIYSFINLVQVLVFSFLICLVGYQLILPGNSMMRRLLFVVYSGGCFTQLFTFAFTCNNLTIASEEIGGGPWTSKWYTTTWCKEGREFAKDLRMVIIRAQRPCRLTAFGFFPITVNTFKSMISTAFSYLTLMRNSREQMQ